MTNTDNENPNPSLNQNLRGENSRPSPIQPRTLDFDGESDQEGPIPTPEEQKAMLAKWREDQRAREEEERERRREGKRAQVSSKQTEIRSQRREADALRLQALRLQREEIELQERVLREALEAEEEELQGIESGSRSKRPRDDQDESADSESHPRRSRSRAYVSSESEEDDDRPRVQDRLKRMEKAMFGGNKLSHEPVVVEAIEQFRPPPGRHFPKMTEFNGKGDPEDHCEKYESLMTGMGHCDTMLCKMFKTYLKGPASMWYRSLRPRSISSYDQVRKKFLKHYSHLCRREKDTESLINCRQYPDEEMGDYLARFKEEAGMVTHLDKVKAAGFLNAGLDPIKSRKLRSSLYDFPPKSLNEIYLRGENIRRKMESIGGYKTKKKDDRSWKKQDKRDNREDTSRSYNKGKADDQGIDRAAERRRDRDQTVFTPLNTSVSKILGEIKGKPGFVRPPKMKIPDFKKNQDKYCDYHQDKGHNTDECYHLKKMIEKMIKAGELNQFVSDLRSKLGPKDDKGKEPEDKGQYRGEVRTITGGTVLGQGSRNAKKRYARQVYNLYQNSSAKQSLPITFTEEDYEGVIWPHEDQLIINPVIGQNKIWKVLVDGGASVNVLYHKAYVQMNLGREQLEPCHEALYCQKAG